MLKVTTTGASNVTQYNASDRSRQDKITLLECGKKQLLRASIGVIKKITLGASFLAITTILMTTPAAANGEPTPDEKIEALEKKVERLEQLLEILLPDEAAGTIGHLKSPLVTSAQSKTKGEQTRDEYVPKKIAGGMAPSQNEVTSKIYGKTTCSMRVYDKVSEIPEDNVQARRYFGSKAAKKEGKFRLISPDLSYATRENFGRIVQCDSDQFTKEEMDSSDTDKIKEVRERASKGSIFDQIKRTNKSLEDTAVNSLIPGRPLQLGGVQPTFELGKSAAATLNISVPIYGRTNSKNICKDISTDKNKQNLGIRCAPGFRSTIFSPFLEFSTPLSDGAGLIFTGVDDDDEKTEGVEFADNISVKAGFDWLNFRGVHYYETERAIAKFLDKAVDTCLRSVRAQRDPKNPNPNISDEIVCSRNNVIDWILALKLNSERLTGFAHAREELAAELANFQWRAPNSSVPTLGFGASIKYTTKDFDYSQATVSDVTLNNTTTVVPDFSRSLVSVPTKPTDNFEVEAHGLIYLDFLGSKYRRQTPAYTIPGVFFVPQITYSSNYAFADKTKFSTCDFDPTIRQGKCEDVQIDRPRRRDITSLSLEARTRMLNVPVFNQLGFAPKVSYRLDDDGFIFDMPVFFSTEGKFTSGIRARYTTGLNDLLRNEINDKWEVSLFFTPLTFQSFK